MAEITVNAKHNVTKERLSDLLCSALEGGSNYWYTIKGFIEPTNMEFLSMAGCDVPSVMRHLDYPLNEGGALIIISKGDGDGDEVNGKREWRLDLTTMQQGLQIMAEKYPKHWADFIAENDDADTADVFLQCALFGDVIYG